MMREYHRNIVDELERYGIKPTMEKTAGSHVRFRWRANGRSQTLLTAATPSDHRAGKNCVAQVRRMMREAGVVPVNTTPSPSSPSSPPSPKLVELPTPLTPSFVETLPVLIPMLCERIARLEREMQTLRSAQVDDFERELRTSRKSAAAPKPKPVAPPPPPKQGDYSWLWRAMRYDQYRRL